MLDILLSQLGFSPQQLQEMARTITVNVVEANERMKRIEAKLGIDEPLVIPGRSDDGQ